MGIILAVIDGNIPHKCVPVFCKISRICCLPPVCTETCFVVADVIVRYFFLVGYLYVNYSPTDISRLMDDVPIFGPFLERTGDGGDTQIETFRLAKSIEIIAESCFATIAMLLLLVGACTGNTLLLRVWVKLWMIFYIFVIADVVLYVVLLQKIVPVVVLIILRVFQSVVYLVMMSLVNSHWQAIEAAREQSDNIPDPKVSIHRALSQYSDPFKTKRPNAGRMATMVV